MKNACLNYREFDLEGDLVGVPQAWHLSAQSFTTLLTFFVKRVGHDGYEWVEKEMCWFAEDMS